MRKPFSLLTFILLVIFHFTKAQNPHINAISRVRISPSGKFAISSSYQNLCIWSLNDKKLLHNLSENVSELVFINDEQFYKSEYQDDKLIVSLWSAVTGKKEKVILEEDKVSIHTFSCKGTYLAAKKDKNLYVVNLKTGQEIPKFRNYPSMATSVDLFFTHDEKYLYQLSNLQTFSRYVVETGEKDWETFNYLNEKLMIKSICHVGDKCFITGKFTLLSGLDDSKKNFYIFHENKKELSSWQDINFEPFKAIFNPNTKDEVVLGTSSNEIGYTFSVENTIFKHKKTNIKTKDFLRDFDLSQDGKYLIVASSSHYYKADPSKKGYAKIEVYDWKTKKKLMEF
jgi:hypothetical protein